jgi:hypothetical protein
MCGMINKADLKPLNCRNCKGMMVKPDGYDKKIKHWRLLQTDAFNNISTIRLYILLPFLSPDRFFYDTKTDAWNRNDLKQIILKGATDKEFLSYLNNRGIAIVECCFCPLHRFFLHGISLSIMSDVLTTCFKRHQLHLLRINKKTPVITLFEEPGSFVEKGIPEINCRIIQNFELYKLVRSNKRFLKLVDSITGV